MKTLFFLLLLLPVYLCDNWAVLVAGSNGYWNYRHQADICHAYQILHENGFPDSNIIVMMYDDIANNDNNLYHGVIINDIDGRNVYEGVPKDYTGSDVTPQNFINVMMGNSSAVGGKKVLKSGPNDNIFVFFSDHGAPGMICFPSDQLYAYQLMSTFEYMYNNKMYANIIIYIEACESGSMFNGLLNSSMRIYAVTASTPNEPSYACCYDNNLQVYLGDFFSVNWLENADSYENDVFETLNMEFNIVQSKTNTSHVCRYGDMSLQNTNFSNFIIYNKIISHKYDIATKHVTNKNIINSRYVALNTYLKRYESSGNIKYLIDSIKELNEHMIMESIFGKINNNSDNDCYPSTYVDSHCMEKKVEKFKELFGPLTEAKLSYLKIFGKDCIKEL